jgi:dipeptidyl aminopeptidase/acylaminoacyl peptidase
LPEVDRERTGVTGISWGGYLTCITAGVDPRFKLAVPVYGCGIHQDTVFEPNLNQLSPELAYRWMAAWGPSNYLGASQMPFLWATGQRDRLDVPPHLLMNLSPYSPQPGRVRLRRLPAG